MLFSLLTLVLAACGGGDDDAEASAEVVETYLQAKIDADGDAIRANICAEMEADIERETTSFAGVTNPRIEGMACTLDASGDTVSCAGEILADYGDETRPFELGTYRVVQEDGVWKWCGETAPAE